MKPSDSVKAVVKMSVRPLDPRAKVPADLEAFFVQEFRSRMNRPAVLALSVMSGWDPCDERANRCKSGVLMFGTRGYVTAHSTGKLSRVSMVDLSQTPAFVDSVKSALDAMTRDLAGPNPGSHDSVPLRFAIELEQHADTVPANRKLFTISIPHYNLPLVLADYPKNARPPRYPNVAELRGVEGEVTVSFTVLENGSVAPESVDLEKAYYREFIQSVFTALATTRYLPARIGSCPVASWVKQSFQFRVR
ncbi:MAG TPA: TonB family protein [Gemmatimonadaceae bacterium]|nr:TonB family protein [Gemmatimonadaceae bacterium]